MTAIFLPLKCFPTDLDNIKKEGELIGKDAVSKGLKFAKELNPQELLSPTDKGKIFDSGFAHDQVINKVSPKNEVYDFITDKAVVENGNKFKADSFDAELFKRSDSIIEQSKNDILETVAEDQNEIIETCFESDAPYKLVIEQTLQVEVTYIPPVQGRVKTCLSHEEKTSHYWKSNAEKDEQKKNKQFENDPTIKSYDVKIKGGGTFSEYVVVSKWTHKDDIQGCTSFKEIKKQTSAEKWEESEKWVANSEQPDLNDPNCSLFSIQCIEPQSTKVINGRNITRPCWKKRATYLIRRPSHRGCDFLRYKSCLQSSKNCVESSEYGCSLWELTFRCVSKLIKRSQSLEKEGLYGQKDGTWETSYSPNTAFPEVLTKFKVFEEMKREIEKSQASDATKIQLFSGKKAICSKSVADNLLYDCCFSLKGLANEIKLSQCSADELALSEMRDKGLCYFIGSYDESLLGLWKSRKESSFCCFPSKLSRVFQEQGRKQLGISWGKAEKPDCRGLTQQEISKIDFTSLDLSEAFEAPPQADFSKHIERLSQKLKNRLEEDNL